VLSGWSVESRNLVCRSFVIIAAYVFRSAVKIMTNVVGASGGYKSSMIVLLGSDHGLLATKAFPIFENSSPICVSY
jgi:hypothetical protein